MDIGNGTTLPGSPLRDTDGGNGGEWVQRTEDVHLNEIEDKGNEKYKQLYNDFLGMYRYWAAGTELIKEELFHHRSSNTIHTTSYRDHSRTTYKPWQ